MDQEQSAASEIVAAVEAEAVKIEPPTSSNFEPIYGGPAIAKVLNKSLLAVYYLLETGRIPAKKMGKTWVTTMGALRSAYEK